MSTIEFAEVLLFILPLAGAALTCAAMHWFPGRLHLTGPNAFGLHIGATVGIPVVTMLISEMLNMEHDALYWAVLLMINSLVCGVAESFCSWLDARQPITLEDVMSNEHSEPGIYRSERRRDSDNLDSYR